MKDFGQALQTASPFLLGLGAQLQGRDPDGISTGLAEMQKNAQAAKRKTAISELMKSMGISGEKAALLDMLPFDQQAAMLMQEQQRMDEDAQFNDLYGTLYGGGGGGYSGGGGASGVASSLPTGGTAAQEIMGSRVSAPNMGAIASGPLNPTPSNANYVAPEDLGNIAPEHAAAKAALVAGGEPGSAVSYASRMLNKGESPNRAELQEFMRTGGAGMDPKTAAWCAAFVNASLGHAGVSGTGKMNARSFLEWGQPVDKPEPGDIAVFSRGDPNGWQGHVGFFQGYDEQGNIKVLGGNQGDAVTVQAYPKDRLLGFRRDGVAEPQKPKDGNVTRKALIKAMQNPQLADWAAMEYQQRFGGAEEKTRVLSQQEAAQMGLPPGAYQMKPDGTISAIGGGGQTFNINTGAENRQWGEPPKDHVWALDETGSVATRPVDVGGRTVMQPVAVPIGTPQSDQEAAASQAQRGVALSQEMQAADNVLDAISGAETILDGRGLGSNIIPEAGIVGSRLADWGLNQEAVDLKNTMATIESNVAFDRLQKMRESSPTGGALGAVSERELTLLSSSITNLQNSTSEPELRKNLAKVKEIYSRIIAKAQLYDNAGDFGFGMNTGVYTPQFIQTMPRDALDKLPIEQMTDEQLAAIEKRIQ